VTLGAALERAETSLAGRTSRRSFLGRLGRTLVVAAAGPLASVALSPERAQAFHICGHIFTTGSCPHPFHPRSRIDRYGFPVHPEHGYPVDDQGDIYLSPIQVRRHICHEVVPEQFRFTAPTILQGTWSRCCNHRIRRIVDCCSRSRIRINGDFSVTGYCHGGRRVFCITYQDTKIRC
jgi:hypothetical protein